MSHVLRGPNTLLYQANSENTLYFFHNGIFSLNPLANTPPAPAAQTDRSWPIDSRFAS